MMKNISKEDKKRYLDNLFSTDPGPGSPERVAATDNIVVEVAGYSGPPGEIAFPHSVFETSKKLWRVKTREEASIIFDELMKEIENPTQWQLPDDYMGIYVVGE